MCENEHSLMERVEGKTSYTKNQRYNNCWMPCRYPIEDLLETHVSETFSPQDSTKENIKENFISHQIQGKREKVETRQEELWTSSSSSILKLPYLPLLSFSLFFPSFPISFSDFCDYFWYVA